MKLKFLITIICAFAAIAVISPQLLADDDDDEPQKEKKLRVTFGGTCFYADWNPVWKKYSGSRMGGFRLERGAYSTSDGQFMGGPFLSLHTSNGWSVSWNWLVARYDMKYEGSVFFRNVGTMAPVMLTSTIYKVDGDMIIAYAINEHVKFFFGPKYQGYSYKQSRFELMPLGFSYLPMPSEDKTELHQGGLGTGFAFTVPLVANLYLLPNISILAMSGINISTQKENLQIPLAFGANSLLSLAYFIEPAHCTISLGGRAQYLYYYRLPSTAYTERHDYFYGVNLSIAFSF